MRLIFSFFILSSSLLSAQEKDGSGQSGSFSRFTDHLCVQVEGAFLQPKAKNVYYADGTFKEQYSFSNGYDYGVSVQLNNKFIGRNKISNRNIFSVYIGFKKASYDLTVNLRGKTFGESHYYTKSWYTDSVFHSHLSPEYFYVGVKYTRFLFDFFVSGSLAISYGFFNSFTGFKTINCTQDYTDFNNNYQPGLYNQVPVNVNTFPASNDIANRKVNLSVGYKWKALMPGVFIELDKNSVYLYKKIGISLIYLFERPELIKPKVMD